MATKYLNESIRSRMVCNFKEHAREKYLESEIGKEIEELKEKCKSVIRQYSEITLPESVKKTLREFGIIREFDSLFVYQKPFAGFSFDTSKRGKGREFSFEPSIELVSYVQHFTKGSLSHLSAYVSENTEFLSLFEEYISLWKVVDCEINKLGITFAERLEKIATVKQLKERFPKAIQFYTKDKEVITSDDEKKLIEFFKEG